MSLSIATLYSFFNKFLENSNSFIQLKRLHLTNQKNPKKFAVITTYFFGLLIRLINYLFSFNLIASNISFVIASKSNLGSNPHCCFASVASIEFGQLCAIPSRTGSTS